MKTRPVDVVRSLAFYAIFYFGTIGYVLAAFPAALMGPRALRVVVDGWSGFHRICARVLLGISVRVEGTLPATGHLVALRHESFFEAIDLPRLLDYPAVFAKAELLRIPGWGWAARTYGLVPVEREQGARTLRAMVTAAREANAAGRVLAIFPEGTRIPVGTVAPLQAGFAGLYKLLALPVVPVAVNSGHLYHRRWKKAGTITVRIGETIAPGLPRAEIEDRVIAAINALNPSAQQVSTDTV